jgi:hypothetical protein
MLRYNAVTFLSKTSTATLPLPVNGNVNHETGFLLCALIKSLYYYYYYYYY